jgi:hypothetical protein
MQRLIAALRVHADFIIFDTPPVLAVTDAIVLSARTDGTIIVAEAGRTRTEALRQTARLLRQANARVVGVVLNKAKGGRQGYYYYRGDEADKTAVGPESELTPDARLPAAAAVVPSPREDETEDAIATLEAVVESLDRPADTKAGRMHEEWRQIDASWPGTPAMALESEPFAAVRDYATDYEPVEEAAAQVAQNADDAAYEPDAAETHAVEPEPEATSWHAEVMEAADEPASLVSLFPPPPVADAAIEGSGAVEELSEVVWTPEETEESKPEPIVSLFPRSVLEPETETVEPVLMQTDEPATGDVDAIVPLTLVPEAPMDAPLPLAANGNAWPEAPYRNGGTYHQEPVSLQEVPDEKDPGAPEVAAVTPAPADESLSLREQFRRGLAQTEEPRVAAESAAATESLTDLMARLDAAVDRLREIETAVKEGDDRV